MAPPCGAPSSPGPKKLSEMHKIFKIRKVLSGAGGAGNVPPLPLIITDHLKREHKPVNDTEFAFYLEGLIQGCGTWGVAPGMVAHRPGGKDLIYKSFPAGGPPGPSAEGGAEAVGGKSGTFSQPARFLVLKFHSLDIGLVYYLKKKIGYGQIKILPTYKEIHYTIKEPKGVSKVYDWIEGKTAKTAFGGAANPPSTRALGWVGEEATRVEDARAYWLTGFLDGAARPEDVNLHLRTWIGGDGPLTHTPARPTEILFELNLNLAGLARQIIEESGRAAGSGAAGISLLNLIWNAGGGSGAASNLNKQPPARPSGRLKVPFPDISIRRIFWQLDKYPLISSKFIKYLKFRKIYRVCQRKEHLTKTGLIKILSLWRLH